MREMREHWGRLQNTVDSILAAVNNLQWTIQQNERDSFQIAELL